jgi:alkylhydroperoxidase family enzyme
MQERLTAIEKPQGLMMRLLYAFSRKQFGKVLTPLKLVYSKLPIAFASWSQKISKLEKQLTLDPMLVLMLRTHIAHINTCTFCIDISRAHAMKQFTDQRKFAELNHYETSRLYSAGERSALRLATELTEDHKISDATYSEASRHFSEKELIEIAWVVTSEHVYNLMNVAFNIESDNLCALPGAMASA